MNLLNSTKEAIIASGHMPSQIIFIGSESTGHRCTWDEFTQLANRNIPDRHGGPFVAVDLVIVFEDGKTLWRHDEEGKDEWIFEKPFNMPKQTHAISTLFTKIGTYHLNDLNPVKPEPTTYNLHHAAKEGKLFDLPKDLLTTETLRQEDASGRTPLEIFSRRMSMTDIADALYTTGEGLGMTGMEVALLLRHGLKLTDDEIIDIMASESGLGLVPDAIAVAIADGLGLTPQQFEFALRSCTTMSGDQAADLTMAYKDNYIGMTSAPNTTYDLHEAAQKGMLFSLPQHVLSVDALLALDSSGCSPLSITYIEKHLSSAGIAERLYSQQNGLNLSGSEVVHLLKQGLALENYEIIDILVNDLNFIPETVVIAVKSSLGLTLDEFDRALITVRRRSGHEVNDMLIAYANNYTIEKPGLVTKPVDSPKPVAEPKPVADLPGGGVKTR